MKESRCFSYKDKSYIAYNYFRKGKFATILEGVSKDSNSQGKV